MNQGEHGNKQGGSEDSKLADRMQKIGRKILVLSGKGGVGKSTVAANLAAAIAREGKKVGLLDIDIHGPSIPTLMGLSGSRVGDDGKSLLPLQVGDNLKVMSIAFLLGSNDDAVIWRGPMKYTVINQFLGEVEWGELDYMVVDSPPGTGDEPLSVAQLIGQPSSAVIVTTGQDLAVADVRRCVSFCRTLKLPIIGLIENMSGFMCPSCGKQIDLFKAGGGEKLAADMDVPFLGKIPFDNEIVSSGDDGKPFVNRADESVSSSAFSDIVKKILM